MDEFGRIHHHLLAISQDIANLRAKHEGGADLNIFTIQQLESHLAQTRNAFEDVVRSRRTATPVNDTHVNP